MPLFAALSLKQRLPWSHRGLVPRGWLPLSVGGLGCVIMVTAIISGVIIIHRRTVNESCLSGQAMGVSCEPSTASVAVNSPAGDGDAVCSPSTCRHAPFNPFQGLLRQGWQLHYLRSSGNGTHFNRTWFGVSLGYWRLRFSVGGPWEEVTEHSSVRGPGGGFCIVLFCCFLF